MRRPTPAGAALPSTQATAPRGAGARVRARAAAMLAAIAPGELPAGGAWANFWPFPSIVFSAFMIAWGAECAQFLVSRGMALAILAWLQALPEFAVEAVIAWNQQIHFMTANFTGSLRLLVGLGWPMIFGTAVWGTWRRERRLLRTLALDDENCVEVVALSLPILYFFVIYYKASLTLVDAGILIAIYLLYLWVLQKLPPREMEHVEDLEYVPRTIMKLPRRPRLLAIIGLFVGGGAILYLAAEPFLHSMLRLAVHFGVSQYIFIQWLAPFLSEFPEKLSAFNWARQRSKAPMALLNMVSANINQWTMLAAMIPIVYSFSLGAPSPIPFDDFQRKEILLTIAQSSLGLLLLANMSFHLVEAAGIFVLWGVQFVVPDLHEEVTAIYFAWVVYELFVSLVVRRRVAALTAFARLWKVHGTRRPAGPDA
jgi:cation:H+ antiporter